MSPGVRLAAGVVAAVFLAFAARPAAAIPSGSGDPCPDLPGFHLLCFDDEPSGSATSAQDYPIVSVVDGLILSEGDAAFLLGLETSGWATTDGQGILNALVPVVEFWFDTTIRFFRIDVVALPGAEGVPVPVVIQGFGGGSLNGSDLSDTGGVLPDGTHEDRLEMSGAFDHVRVFAASGACSGGLDCELGPTTSFFGDTVKFIVPEPGAPLLLASTALAAGAVRRRRRRER